MLTELREVWLHRGEACARLSMSGTWLQELGRKNTFWWAFACILVAGWERRIHILNFIYIALRTDWLPCLVSSAKKCFPAVFFLNDEFPSFKSTAATGTSTRLSR